MGEILAVVITMGARELVCGERERGKEEGRKTGIWYRNIRENVVHKCTL